MFNGSEVIKEQFDIQQISTTDDFYFDESIADSLFYQYALTDSAGILMKEYNGEIFYNPVQIAQRALYFLSTYQITNDIIYLDWAEKYALTLIELFGKLGFTVGVLKIIPSNGSSCDEKVSLDQSRDNCRIPIPTPAAPLYRDLRSFPLNLAALDMVNSLSS